MPVLEICCESVQSGLNAQDGGADRIELCSNLAQGGTTPSAGQIIAAKNRLKIPVYVLIRPRKGDFLYSPLEFETILTDIQNAKNLGADGIVSGCLTAEGFIDYQRVRILVEAASPLPFTLHRAFDMCRNPLEALPELAKIGVIRVLTSGQHHTALEGLSNLRAYVNYAADRITIMAGGNIRPENLDPLLEIPGLNEFHSSARGEVQSSMLYFGRTKMGNEALEAEFVWQEVHVAQVQQLRAKLNARR